MQNLILRLSIIVTTIVFFVNTSISQQVIGGTYTKLQEVYNKGKYEQCLLKADNYTYKEDYSRDAEPYLYLSMCFYKLYTSDDPDIQYDYQNGLKEAVRYAIKFNQKDKKDELYSKNIEYIKLIKTELYKDAKGFFESGSYSKAATSGKNYNRLNRETDPCIDFFVGITTVLAKNQSAGEQLINDAKEAFKAKQKAGNVVVDAIFKSLIVDSVLKYSEILVQENKLAEAKDCLETGKLLFPENGYINVQLNMVNKALAGN